MRIRRDWRTVRAGGDGPASLCIDSKDVHSVAVAGHSEPSGVGAVMDKVASSKAVNRGKGGKPE